jgi:hypothetical protein
MSKVVEEAPNEDGVPVTLQVVLSDSSVFLDNGRWFKLLQDDGKEMFPEEILICQEPTTGKPKRKYRTISHGVYFYQELYSLAGDVLALLEKKWLNYFPQLPKSSRNMSLTIHYIGKAIATHQILCARADIHNIGSMDAGITDEIRIIEYGDRDRFYILSQQNLLEFRFKKYGVEEEMKEVTTDDKVRVAGILFNHSQLQEYIPDMLGKTRGSKVRADLDAMSSRKLAGFRTLFTRFIDKEAVVTVPEKWLWEETKTSIDALTCDGTFDLHRKFNPNNLLQIPLN